jgi:hypothetical protein
MSAVSKRRMLMGNRRKSKCRYVLVFSIALGLSACAMPSHARAGGVYLGFGVDVPGPGYAVAPPEVYPPPVVVERRPPPPPVVVERRPPPVVFERTPPPPPVVVERRRPYIAYEEPTVVEHRSSVYYYYHPSYQYRSYNVETERNYYRQSSRDWEDDCEY